MRRLIAFPCAGETLVGTLDTAEHGAPGRTGLLIVSGGNEIRCGAHRGMALLAARLADDGIPVFRFDRRGIGDSTGGNSGFEGSAPDIAAAAATFAAESGVARLVGFGNCDAATALALYHAAGIDALILANPWVREEPDALPPAAAIRARYAARLRDPAAWRRLLGGGVDLGMFIKGLIKIFTANYQMEPPLARRMREALAGSGISATIVLATGDATALAFTAAWRGTGIPIHRIATASHSFARAGDAAALEAVIRGVLAGAG